MRSLNSRYFSATCASRWQRIASGMDVDFFVLGSKKTSVINRDKLPVVLFQDDLFLGSRFGFNDADSSELLVGTIIDMEDHSTSFRTEGNRRIFGKARVGLKAQVFTHVDGANSLSSLQDSDFLRLTFEYFF